MAFPEDPIVTDRAEVLADEAARRRIRGKLFGDVETARQVLAPRYQYRRWMDRNKAEARRVGKEAARVARKGAPVAGMVGIGSLLFLARKPISKWISQLRKRKNNTPSGD